MDTFFLMILYYVLSLLSGFIFFYCLYKYKIKFLSFSTLSYLVALVLAILPGYYIAEGDVFRESNPSLFRGFDYEIYFIYLFFSILMPMGLLLGRLLSSNLYLEIPERSFIRYKMIFLTLFLIVYSLAYYYWVPTIPLWEMIKGNLDFMQLSFARSSITHALGSAYSVPILFGYWRMVIQVFAITIFIYWLNCFRFNKVSHYFYIFFLFILISYGHLFTLEKAPFIYFVIAIIFNYYFSKRVPINFKTIYIAFGLVLLVSVMYYFFMKASPYTVFQSISRRLLVQTSSIYDQINYIRENGYLLFDNMKMNYINEHPLDVSRWSFARIYPKSFNYGIVGSAGGLSIANLYFSFSSLGFFVFFVMMVLYGFIDGVFITSILYSKSTKTFINKAFYISISSYFILVLVSDVFLLIQFPTIVSRGFYPIILFYFFLAKLESLRIRIKK